jgi:hypothetical protein
MLYFIKALSLGGAGFLVPSLFGLIGLAAGEGRVLV